MGNKVTGVNGYTGEYFDFWFCELGGITQTDTISINLQLVQEDNVTPIGDVAGDVLVLSFASTLNSLSAGDLLLEVEILPIVPTTEAEFLGEITTDQTYSLPVGTVYASIARITAARKKYILDMAKFKVFSSVSQRRA